MAGPNPIDRGTAQGAPGTKRHLAVDRQGVPLVAGLTGAARPDATVFAAVIDAIPPVRGPRGRPRQRPEKVHADKGDDARHCRRYLHRRGIKVRIARKGIEDTSRLGRWRWVVGRTSALGPIAAVLGPSARLFSDNCGIPLLTRPLPYCDCPPIV